MFRKDSEPSKGARRASTSCSIPFWRSFCVDLYSAQKCSFDMRLDETLARVERKCNPATAGHSKSRYECSGSHARRCKPRILKIRSTPDRVRHGQRVDRGQRDRRQRRPTVRRVFDSAVLRPNPTAWGWASRSAVRSSRIMADGIWASEAADPGRDLPVRTAGDRTCEVAEHPKLRPIPGFRS